MPLRLFLSFFLIIFGAGVSTFIFLNLRRPPQESPVNLFLIQSGSMAPAVNIGDLILTVKKDRYFSGEVIAFRDKEARTVTHRVQNVSFEEGQFHYITKGDASLAADIAEISGPAVFGRVGVVIPFLGRLLPLIQSPPGFILMIFLPGLILFLFCLSDFLKQ